MQHLKIQHLQGAIASLLLSSGLLLPAGASARIPNPQPANTQSAVPTSEQSSQGRPAQRPRPRFVPPKLKLNRGIPVSGRSYNAARSCGNRDKPQPLTPLAPLYQDTVQTPQGRSVERRYAMALAATPRPVFWAYVTPDEGAEQVTLEFVLQDAAGNERHSEMLTPPAQPGLMRIQPGAAMADLLPGEDYRWFLKQKSTCRGSVGSAQVLDVRRENGEAWVRYQPLDGLLGQVIAQAAPAELAGQYSEAGYWYDALEAQAQQLQRGQADAQADWMALLEAIALAPLAEVPLHF